MTSSKISSAILACQHGMFLVQEWEFILSALPSLPAIFPVREREFISSAAGMTSRKISSAFLACVAIFQNILSRTEYFQSGSGSSSSPINNLVSIARHSAAEVKPWIISSAIHVRNTAPRNDVDSIEHTGQRKGEKKRKDCKLGSIISAGLLHIVGSEHDMKSTARHIGAEAKPSIPYTLGLLHLGTTSTAQCMPKSSAPAVRQVVEGCLGRSIDLQGGPGGVGDRNRYRGTVAIPDHVFMKAAFDRKADAGIADAALNHFLRRMPREDRDWTLRPGYKKNVTLRLKDLHKATHIYYACQHRSNGPQAPAPQPPTLGPSRRKSKYAAAPEDKLALPHLSPRGNGRRLRVGPSCKLGRNDLAEEVRVSEVGLVWGVVRRWHQEGTHRIPGMIEVVPLMVFIRHHLVLFENRVALDNALLDAQRVKDRYCSVGAACNPLGIAPSLSAVTVEDEKRYAFALVGGIPYCSVRDAFVAFVSDGASLVQRADQKGEKKEEDCEKGSVLTRDYPCYASLHCWLYKRSWVPSRQISSAVHFVVDGPRNDANTIQRISEKEEKGQEQREWVSFSPINSTFLPEGAPNALLVVSTSEHDIIAAQVAVVHQVPAPDIVTMVVESHLHHRTAAHPPSRRHRHELRQLVDGEPNVVAAAGTRSDSDAASCCAGQHAELAAAQQQRLLERHTKASRAKPHLLGTARGRKASVVNSRAVMREHLLVKEAGRLEAHQHLLADEQAGLGRQAALGPLEQLPEIWKLGGVELDEEGAEAMDFWSGDVSFLSVLLASRAGGGDVDLAAGDVDAKRGWSRGDGCWARWRRRDWSIVWRLMGDDTGVDFFGGAVWKGRTRLGQVVEECLPVASEYDMLSSNGSPVSCSGGKLTYDGATIVDVVELVLMQRRMVWMEEDEWLCLMLVEVDDVLKEDAPEGLALYDAGGCASMMSQRRMRVKEWLCLMLLEVEEEERKSLGAEKVLILARTVSTGHAGLWEGPVGPLSRIWQGALSSRLPITPSRKADAMALYNAGRSAGSYEPPPPIGLFGSGVVVEVPLLRLEQQHFISKREALGSRVPYYADASHWLFRARAGASSFVLAPSLLGLMMSDVKHNCLTSELHCHAHIVMVSLLQVSSARSLSATKRWLRSLKRDQAELTVTSTHFVRYRSAMERWLRSPKRDQAEVAITMDHEALMLSRPRHFLEAAPLRSDRCSYYDGSRGGYAFECDGSTCNCTEGAFAAVHERLLMLEHASMCAKGMEYQALASDGVINVSLPVKTATARPFRMLGERLRTAFELIEQETDTVSQAAFELFKQKGLRTTSRNHPLRQHHHYNILTMDSNTPYYSPLASSSSAATNTPATPTLSSPDRLSLAAVDSAETLLATTTTTTTQGKKRLHYPTLVTALKSTLSKFKKWAKKKEKDERPRRHWMDGRGFAEKRWTKAPASFFGSFVNFGDAQVLAMEIETFFLGRGSDKVEEEEVNASREFWNARFLYLCFRHFSLRMRRLGRREGPGEDVKYSRYECKRCARPKIQSALYRFLDTKERGKVTRSCTPSMAAPTKSHEKQQSCTSNRVQTAHKSTVYSLSSRDKGIESRSLWQGSIGPGKTQNIVWNHSLPDTKITHRNRELFPSTSAEISVVKQFPPSALDLGIKSKETELLRARWRLLDHQSVV
ncbi:uncharacterized protein MYCFIDRAFT_172239 [Pseudocercospora fijiensis CIRAD86]|uniref:Uncharacterized protein n=1 Tax=Pseudocercospora fijiensis (strain CIRAD86) TaxID=383855 RepID=M2Z9I2_PSEFD|nr:uncharacterized protein MYCFIDRAFT_172239 [Pseudocercospora fijiensis CIRAD86]EME86495.1 hypothetical protein MYCFIDRAFT_172239 [Pseudocercospora fijiensis CIRAD86]